MALLEAYRLKAETEKPEFPDTALRTCQAIIAGVFGFNCRDEWTNEIKAAGLIDYNDHEVDPGERYRKLHAIVKDIKLD